MAPRFRQRWLPEEDELLLSLRRENLEWTWKEVTENYNSRVLNARVRSEDAVKKRTAMWVLLYVLCAWIIANYYRLLLAEK